MCCKQKEFTELPEEYIVICENGFETNEVLRVEYPTYSPRFSHWRYVIKSDEFKNTHKVTIENWLSPVYKDFPQLTFNKWKELINKSKDMELKVTKEKVLAAASKCTTAKQVLQELFPEAFVTYKRGDKFVDSWGNRYILAQTDLIDIAAVMCLISLKDGNRHRNPYKVNDLKAITETEFKNIAGDLTLLKTEF